MDKELNKIILTKVLDLIPENIKPVNFFMDYLDIGKESAYRRLRGEKPLSVEELYKLSLELNFSLDDIIDNNKKNTVTFNHIGSFEQGPEKNLHEFLRYYETYLKRLINADNSEIICTMNHLVNSLIVGYEHLFKFIYYRWIHQMTEVPLNYYYSSCIIPAEIKEICNRTVVLHTKIKKVTYIIDNNLFLNLVKEIQYYYIRGLIDKDELNILKEEFLNFMDNIEKMMNKGIDKHGTNINIYLSVFHINSTTAYAKWDDNEESAFWHHYGYPIYTRNKEITKRHRLWINSLKKYSTVISQSNELLQAEFMNRQRNYISNMPENDMI